MSSRCGQHHIADVFLQFQAVGAVTADLHLDIGAVVSYQADDTFAQWVPVVVRHFAFHGKHDFRQHKMVYQVQSFGLTAVGGEVTLFFVSLKRNAEVIAVAVKR